MTIEQSWLDDKAAVEDELRHYSFAEDPGPGYDVADFDFDKDPERMVQGYSDMEASGTDLSKFKARGGKLLIYQGLADGLQAPEATPQWYEALTKDMGGEAATMDFARLFLVPGHQRRADGEQQRGVGGSAAPLPAGALRPRRLHVGQSEPHVDGADERRGVGNRISAYTGTTSATRPA